MSEYIQNGTSLYKEVKPNKRVDYKTDIDEFEFKRTPETDAMLKQICVKECFVRCKDCKYMKIHGWNPKKEVSTCHYHCEFWNHAVDDCDFCSRGERAE